MAIVSSSPGHRRGAVAEATLTPTLTTKTAVDVAVADCPPFRHHKIHCQPHRSRPSVHHSSPQAADAGDSGRPPPTTKLVSCCKCHRRRRCRRRPADDAVAQHRSMAGDVVEEAGDRAEAVLADQTD